MAGPPDEQLVPAGSPGPGRFRRAVGVAGGALGLTLVFAGALVFSVLAHLDLAPTRRVVRTVTNGFLGTLFKGKIVVGEIERLSLRGITVREATAFDPDGNQVARLAGLRADADVIGIVRSAVRGGLAVPIALVRVDDADVGLDRGSNGVPGIAEAFLLREPSPPPEPGAVTPTVTLGRIELGHLKVHGAVAPMTNVDAELRDVAGSVLVTAEGVDVDIAPLAVVARAPVPQPLDGRVRFHLRVPPSTPGAPPKAVRMEGGFDGKVGEIEVHADAVWEGVHVRAEARAPRVTPQAIAAFLPPGQRELPLQRPVAVTARAEGDLPDLAVSVLLAVEGGGEVAVAGQLRVTNPLEIDAKFKVAKLDPAVIVKGLPAATPIDAEGRAKLSLGAEVRADVALTTEPMRLGGNVVPRISATAKLEKGAVEGRAQIDEEGAPTTATFAVDADQRVRFEVQTRAASLAAVKRIGGAVDGAARVKVAGTFKDGALDARVTGHVDDVRAPGGVSLGTADVEARVHGPATSPTVDATVRGARMRAGKYAWDTVQVKASGPVLSGLRVEAQVSGRGESIAVAGAVDVRDKAMRGVTLSIKRKDGEVAGKIDRIAAGPGGVVLEGLALRGEGVGEIEGGLRVVGKELVGRLRGRNVDLARVAAMADVRLGLAGLANVDVDLRSDRPGQRTGHVALELVNGEIARELGGIGGLFSATFEGDRVRLDGLLRLVAHAAPKEPEGVRCDGTIASVRVSNGVGVLTGPLLDPSTWARATGRVDVAADDWNLRCVARLEPLTEAVLSEVRGLLTTRVTLARTRGTRFPSVRRLLVKTRGLSLAGVRGADDKPEWASRSMDVELRGSFDAKSGALLVSGALDDGRPIASLEAGFPLDLAALVDHPEMRARLLEELPLDVSLHVPRRAIAAFASLPSFIAGNLPPLAGEVALEASIVGTLKSPRAEVTALGWGVAHARPTREDPRSRGKVRPQVESAWAFPVDVTSRLTWEGPKLLATLQVKRGDDEVVRGKADLALSLADVVAGKPIAPTGDVRAEVVRLPIGEVPFLADRDIRGHLDGSLALLGLGKDPTLDLSLRVPDLAIGRDLTYDKAEVSAVFGRKKDATGATRNAAAVRAEISSKAGGRFLAATSNDVLWHGGFVPDIDVTRSADLIVRAQRFRVAALGPFVSSLLSKVDGTLDGDAALSWARLDHPDEVKAAVSMKLVDGVFHVPQLGQELHGAEVALSGGAGGLIKLDTIRAEAQKGRISGSGSVLLEGLAFRKAEASFLIKPGEELPVAIEGLPRVEARGRVKITAEQKKSLLAVVVDVPSLDVVVPKLSTRGGQSLDQNPDISILNDERRPPRAARREAAGLSLTVKLGNVGVKGAFFDFGLSGAPDAPLKVELLDETRITGDIQFTRGRIEVLHRQFELDQGSVHMRPEDPGNPYVKATVRWESPDGPIFIDYTGNVLPVTPEKIKWHSPTIPDDRVQATLLLGSMDQATQGSTSAPGQAPVPGQALLAQLIAQQLSTEIAGNISTSVAANEDGSFRPGLVYRSGDKVIELSTYGATGQGSSAATKGQHTLITVDWRFWRNWMLRGRVDVAPDQTTSGVDVLWQYRY